MPTVDAVSVEELLETDILIAVMGPTGAGKSTFIDAATKQDGQNVGTLLKSCTSDVRAVRCTTIVHNRSHQVVLIDTPGFDDTVLSDMEVLDRIAQWLTKSYRKERKLSGILYFHRITDNRMGGSPLKNLHMFGNLCGDGSDIGKKIVLTTTMWGMLRDPQVGVTRERELLDRWWKPMIERGSTCARFETAVTTHAPTSPQEWARARAAAWNILHPLVQPDAEEAVLLQNEMVELKKRLAETEAGKTLYTTLQKLLVDQKETIRLLREQADGQSDPKLVADLNKQYEQIDKQLRKTFEQVEKLKIPFGRRLLLFFNFKKAPTRALKFLP